MTDLLFCSCLSVAWGYHAGQGEGCWLMGHGYDHPIVNVNPESR